MADIDQRQRIQTRAFYLWNDRAGKAWWDPVANWLEAEQAEHNATAQERRSAASTIPDPSKISQIYRFRSIDALLGEYAELDGQYVYLSSPDQLNDPMEGYQDVFWRGDSILWENLLRHYILALLWSTVDCLLMDASSFHCPPIAATLTEDDLPTDAFRRIYHDACDDFFSNSGMPTVPIHLGSLAFPLRADGLRLVLSTMHLVAFSSVTAAMQRARLMPNGWGEFVATADMTRHAVDLVHALARQAGEAPQVEIETFALASNQLRERQTLKFLLGCGNAATSAANQKKLYLLFSFPDAYVRGVRETLIHPPWYVSCFSSDCTDASMWASYGDQHKGAALVFRVEHDENGKPFLPLSIVTGFSASQMEPSPRFHKGRVSATLHPVRYTNRAPEIDFFQFLGMLPRPKLQKTWHSNKNGEHSPITMSILENEATWRERLWQSFYAMSTTKLEDWSHEAEFRVVFSDALGMRKENRKAEYEFSQLVGVVFGLRTAINDKLRVIELIQKKCKEAKRSDFNFYQMIYHPMKGCLFACRTGDLTAADIELGPVPSPPNASKPVRPGEDRSSHDEATSNAGTVGRSAR